MARGTLTLITRKTGEGGKATKGLEVMRFKQMLYMAGYKTVGLPNYEWDKNTTTAWMQYQEEFCQGPRKTYIDALDPENKLTNLAWLAGVLVPLANETGARGMKAQFETMQMLGVPYSWAKHGTGALMTWGLRLNGNVSWAICTRPGGNVGGAILDMKMPRSSNCTSMANLLMSIWVGGNLHHAKYRADQIAGGDKPENNLARRYDYWPLKGSPKPAFGYAARPGLYTSVEEIEADTKPGVLYHFGMCDGWNGNITHDTVLLDGEVYECNLGRGSKACYKTPLAQRWKRMQTGDKKKVVIISGPGGLTV